MTYEKRFINLGIDVSKAVVMTIGTDGLGEKAKILAVSIVGPTQESTVGTMYIQGGRPELNYEFTEVTPEHYVENAMSIGEARQLMMPVLNWCPCIAVFGAGFLLPKFFDYWPEFIGMPYLDVMDLAKFADRRFPFPENIKSLRDLQTRLTATTSYIRGGYKLDELMDRYVQGYDGDTADARIEGSSPKLERQPYRLYALWRTLLEKGD
jgi:hypothetical protein